MQCFEYTRGSFSTSTGSLAEAFWGLGGLEGCACISGVNWAALVHLMSDTSLTRVLSVYPDARRHSLSISSVDTTPLRRTVVDISSHSAGDNSRTKQSPSQD